MPWSVTWEGKTHADKSITVGEAERICEGAKTNWASLHPVTSPTHMAVVVAVLAERDGHNYGEVLAKVRAMTIDEAMDLLTLTSAGDDRPTEYENGIPPEADGT